MRHNNPAVCIIDDSALTTKIYSYLFKQFLRHPDVSTYTQLIDINISDFNSCDLIMIDEIMDDMTGTTFIHSAMTKLFDNRWHDFPNVIFCSTIEVGDLHERIKGCGLDRMIPAYRIIQKPVSPTLIKETVISICPGLESCIVQDSVSPNTELPWPVSMKRSIREILGMDIKPISNIHTVSF